MRKIITSSGFETEIKETTLDNMEFVDALAELNENELAISKVIVMLLGKENKKRLYDHIRRDDGTVPVEKATAEISEILEQLGEEVKN